MHTYLITFEDLLTGEIKIFEIKRKNAVRAIRDVMEIIHHYMAIPVRRDVVEVE
mgnify:CR=1 FL=1